MKKIDTNETGTPNTIIPAKAQAVIELEEQTEEEKEIKAQLTLINKFPKLRKWATLITDKNNPKTYGNRTESAMQSYNCKDRISAAEIGAQNFRKLKGLLIVLAEDKGFTVDKLFNIAMARSVSSENPKWWEMTASMLQVYDPRSTPSTLIQNNIAIQNINEPEKVDFNKTFKEFVEKQ